VLLERHAPFVLPDCSLKIRILSLEIIHDGTEFRNGRLEGCRKRIV
jgi:hypothetical protein